MCGQAPGMNTKLPPRKNNHRVKLLELINKKRTWQKKCFATKIVERSVGFMRYAETSTSPSDA